MAREESLRLQHEYVGTEHILLAVIREGEGTAAAVLQNLNVDLDQMSGLIDGIVKPGRAAAPTGPDLPYTSRAKKVLELAMAEARDLNHKYVGTEHLLIGLLREEKGIAAQVLVESGVTIDTVRTETLRLLGTTYTKYEKNFTTEMVPLYPPQLDALQAAPDHHKLLLENENVRVLETKIPAGATTPVHVHRWPAVHYVVSWSQFVRCDDHGNVLLDTRLTDFNQNAPQALWGAPLLAHTVENVGSDLLHIISVELKHSRSIPSI